MIDENQIERMRHEYWQMQSELMRFKLIAASLTQENALLKRHIRRLKTEIERLKRDLMP